MRHDQFQNARRISRAIQEHLESTGDNGIRSTDIYPILAKKGLVEKDRNQGLKFRKFLKTLYNEGTLKELIPQCKPVPSTNNPKFIDWYFYRANINEELTNQNIQTEDVIFINVPLIHDEEVDELISEYKHMVDLFPKRNPSLFNYNQMEIRKLYSRAYEIWTNREIDLLLLAWNKFRKINKVAELLKRQPDVVEKKLKERKII